MSGRRYHLYLRFVTSFALCNGHVMTVGPKSIVYETTNIKSSTVSYLFFAFRERKDHMSMVHRALRLSKEHLALFHPRDSPNQNPNAWRALDALDNLVLHLAGTAEVQHPG